MKTLVLKLNGPYLEPHGEISALLLSYVSGGMTGITPRFWAKEIREAVVEHGWAYEVRNSCNKIVERSHLWTGMNSENVTT